MASTSSGTKSISSFIKAIETEGGFSISNNYDVEFSFKSSGLKDRFTSYGIKLDSGSSSSEGALIKLLCDEAQLPNVQSSTGQITGRFMGEGIVNYAHTRLYSDFQLGWLCDANMTPLKFLNLWYGYIFREFDSNGEEIKPKYETSKKLSDVRTLATDQKNILSQRSLRLAFPDEYMSTIVITKTERGTSAPNSRASIAYSLLDAFPYSIDAVPLSYGASQVTKVTANFYYSKHTVTYNNIGSYSG